MAKIEKLVPFLLKWEGGYVNHPKDKGGHTNKGVTYETWVAYRKKMGKEASLTSFKNMSQEEWTDILRQNYWDVWQADKIGSQRIANMLVDWLWMSGARTIKKVQKILQVKCDGIVGAKTIAAINGHSDVTLFGLIKESRKAYYEGIVRLNPSQKVFLKGWLNRLEDLSRL